MSTLPRASPPAPPSPPPPVLSVLGNKRIAFYTDDAGEGGVAVYNHAMVCGLARAGLDVSCIQTKSDGPLQEIEAGLGVKHFWLPFDSLSIKEANRLAHHPGDTREAFAKLRPDVVIFVNRCPISLVAAKNVAVEQDVPFIVVEGYAEAVDNIGPSTAWYMRQVKEHHHRAQGGHCGLSRHLAFLAQ